MTAIVHIFLIFAYFGCLCLSGGSSLFQFYIDELVYARGWLTLEQLGNFMAISQVTPGPIGVNLATFIGFRQGGFWGGLAGTVGLLTPSFILMSLAVKSYRKWQESRPVRSLMFGLRPVTAALMASALIACLGMSVFDGQLPFDALLNCFRNVHFPRLRMEMLPVFVFAYLVFRRRKLPIAAVIFSSAALGMVLHFIVIRLGLS